MKQEKPLLSESGLPIQTITVNYQPEFTSEPHEVRMSMQTDEYPDCFGNYETAQLAIDGEALGLMAMGYRPVIHVELH